jgi:hypothetical protein
MVFTQTFNIQGEERRLRFVHYRAAGASELYMIRGFEEPCFMEYDQETQSWKFCHQIAPAIKAMEESLSRAICDHEQCGGDEDDNPDAYNFLT